MSQCKEFIYTAKPQNIRKIAKNFLLMNSLRLCGLLRLCSVNSGFFKVIFLLLLTVPVYADIVAEDCQSKDVEAITNYVQQILPQTKNNCIDYTSKDGKNIIAKFDLAYLPFVYFDKDIQNAENFLNLVKQGVIDKKNEYFFIPQNRLPAPKLFLLNREKQDSRLDLFVMSQCPFGKDAERILIEYIRSQGIKIDLKIHHIVTFRKYGIDSLHGPEEIHEDVQQLLLQKYYPDKFFDYLLMRNQGKPFEVAVKELGIDAQKLILLNAEGVKLLEENFALTRQLNIRSSPTVLYKNQYLMPRFDMLSKEEPFTKLPPLSGKGSCQ